MKIIIVFLLIISAQAYAQSKRVEKTKVVYQKRQKIDLGQLMIDGDLVSPGDFSVTNEKEKASGLLFKRKNHNDRLRINIEYVF